MGMTLRASRADWRNFAEVELFEEAFNSCCEERSIVAGVWNVRIAVTRVVQSIDGETFGELRHDIFEQVELRPQRMEEDDGRTCAGLDIAELGAADLHISDRDLRGPTAA
jgi:hypothetical protein